MGPTPRRHESGERVDAGAHEVVGRIQLRRVGRWRFPVFELVQDETRVATVGRLGWIRIYLGRGSRVELADGTRWKIRSATIGGFVCPVVVDASARKVAFARGGTGIYGITGRDFGFTLNPGRGRKYRANVGWILRHHEDDVALVTQRPPTLDASASVHLGAVLLTVVLIRYGVPDDSRIWLPSIRWG